MRLRGYDYAQAGAYFVTICARGQECLFGEVVGGEMRRNGWGAIVTRCWDELPQHYPTVELDAFTAMPNHVHGIIVLTDPIDVIGAGSQSALGIGVAIGAAGLAGVVSYHDTGGSPRRAGFKPAPTEGTVLDEKGKAVRKPLSEIVRAFKTFSARRINEGRGAAGAAIWQRGYYDHVIRTERSLERIREYIAENPARWAMDQLHPDSPSRW